MKKDEIKARLDAIQRDVDEIRELYHQITVKLADMDVRLPARNRPDFRRDSSTGKWYINHAP